MKSQMMPRACLLCLLLALSLFVSFLKVPSASAGNPEWRGMGLDYMDSQFAVDLAISHWKNEILRMRKWGLNTARLGFSFAGSGASAHSRLVYNDLDKILALLNQSGIGAVMDLHNWRDMSGYFGSQNWTRDWVSFAKRYKNDGRIVAYELFNEPNKETWHSSITGGGCFVPYNGTGKSVSQALAECVDAIRATGDNHVIVYPDPYYFSSKPSDMGDPSTYLASRWRRTGNIVFGMHEWMPENTPMTTAEMQSFFDKNYPLVDSWAIRVPIWLGEFGFYAFGNTTVGKQWVLNWINHANQKGFGFSIWMHGFPSRDYAWRGYSQVLYKAGCGMIDGDVDWDFDVDIYDLIKIGRAYGSRAGDSKFERDCDVDCDGAITLFDIMVCLINYEKSLP